MPNQPATARLTGEISIGNFSETPLGPNGIFTGTFEDIRDAAFLSITVSTDVESAPAG